MVKDPVIGRAPRWQRVLSLGGYLSFLVLDVVQVDPEQAVSPPPACLDQVLDPSMVHGVRTDQHRRDSGVLQALQQQMSRGGVICRADPVPQRGSDP